MRIAVWAVALLAGVAVARADVPEFERDVLPVFRKHCVACHDSRKQTAGYRLDVRARAMAGGESGEPAIVPHASDRSGLLARVTSDDEFSVMPPEGPRLNAGEIATLRAWIDAGAAWPDALAGDDPRAADHWAFRPPTRPQVPTVGNLAWLRNPVDAFVMAKLDAVGLQPAPLADRVTLLRRLHFDLTGLPPTPAEADAFLEDTAPAAYERLVERLLASPHYGERWGRTWLDAARYADSDGYEKDKPRFVWFYRDWVIDAFNHDLPYDEFLRQQFAGDLSPPQGSPADIQDRLVATGFLRNSMLNEEGGADPEQFRMEAMFDRMDALGKAALGLTVQCAQCHDHKFDPLSQEEYFGLLAFLNNDNEGSATVFTRAELATRANIHARTAAIEAELKTRLPDWPAWLAAWETAVRGNQPAWQIVRPHVDTSGGEKHFLLADGSILAQSYAPTKSTLEFSGATDLPEVAAVRLELLNDANLPRGGPGRSIFGTCAVTEFRVQAAPQDGSEPPRDVPIVSATASVEPPVEPLGAIFDDRSGKPRTTGPIAFALDGKPETAWSSDAGPGRHNQPQQAVFRFTEPVRSASGVRLTFKITQNHGGWNSDDNQTNNLGRFRLSATAAPAATADTLPAAVREILETTPVESRSAAEAAAVFAAWRPQVPDFAPENARIAELWTQFPLGTSQLVLTARDEPRTTSLLRRGDFLSPVRPVEPGVPAFLHPLPTDLPRDRRALAAWIADRDSPTTARTLVNRVWQIYFGTGIVATSEDLGTQSAPPSHADLLDWLAVEFMDRGWSLKELHRLIVGSATYRQSSRTTPKQRDNDPANRLLARGPRFRVPAETVRDVVLSASGLLNQEVGGPPVYPPLPEFLLRPPVSYGPKAWPVSQGADCYRRAVYIFRFRSLPYPMLQTFDAPPGDTACVRRERSNTPLQALVTLNEPMFLDCARSLAAQTLAAGATSDEERITDAFRRCVTRSPSAPEREELQRLLDAQRARFERGEADATALAGPNVAEGPAPAELAAWTALARVLLNLDEVITKE